jgi:hypothetical protein
MPSDAPEPVATQRRPRVPRDPVALRRPAWLATLLVAIVGGVGYGRGGGLGELLLAAGWTTMPFLALGVAVGDAFFLRHGRGLRRVLLRASGALVVVLGGCLALSVLPTGAGSLVRRVASGALYAVLFFAIVTLIAALLAVAIGRGEGYLSRKIQAVDDEGW